MTLAAMTVPQLLRAGFGVEDIAITKNLPVDRLRQTVTSWRRAMVLSGVLGLPRRHPIHLAPGLPAPVQLSEL